MRMENKEADMWGDMPNVKMALELADERLARSTGGPA